MTLHHINNEIETVLEPRSASGQPLDTLTSALLALLLSDTEDTMPAYDLATVRTSLLSAAFRIIRDDLPGAHALRSLVPDDMLSAVLADIRSGKLTARHLTSA